MSKGNLIRPDPPENGDLNHKNPFRREVEEETMILPRATREQAPRPVVSVPDPVDKALEELLMAAEREKPAPVKTPDFSMAEGDAREEPAIPGEDSAFPQEEPDPAVPPVSPNEATRVIPQVPEEELFSIPLDEEPRLTEDQAIEKAFRDSVGGDDDLPPISDSFHAFWHSHKKPLLLGVGAIFLVLILIIAGISLAGRSSDPYDGLILNNVTVAGVNLGGMDQSQAMDAVRQAVAPFETQTMLVNLPGAALRLDPRDTEARVDVKAAVKAAYSYGRTGSQDQRQADYENSLRGNHTISLLPYLRLDEKFIVGCLEDYAEKNITGYTPSSYALEGSMPPLDLDEFDENNPTQTLMLTVGTPGGNMDLDSVYGQILDAYGMCRFEVRIDQIQADTMPKPLDLKKIHEEFYIEPVDSQMDMQEFEVIPGSYGYGFDLAAAERLLAKAEFGDTVTLPMEYIRPELLEEDVLFQDVLGSAETPHGDNENRNTNLRLACEALNGLVLYPGDTFSYNETLGQRTAEKGYKPAPAYSGHELVNSYGGGICQVSSTLYLSCLLSDLEIVDRINHGFLPSYIEKGMDATVSWGNPDFKFRNNGTFPIKIQAEATRDKVIIKILGTDDRNYYVQMEPDIVSTYTPKIVHKEFPASSGYTNGELIQGGIVGYSVKTYRCKYDSETGKLISRDYEATSNYIGQDYIYAVIVPDETEPPETEPPVTDPETTTPQKPETKPSDPTKPSTDPTKPSTDPTKPSTDPTKPSTDPTKPSTDPLPDPGQNGLPWA